MTRLLSAIVIAGAVVGVLVWAPFLVIALFAALVAALAAAEVAALARSSTARVPAPFVAVAGAVLTLAFVASEALITPVADDILPSVLLGVIVVGGVLTLRLGPPGPDTLTRAAAMVMAPIYVGLPLGAVLWVRCALGAAATLWMLGTVIVSDSAQYYTGRAFGRRKLAPTVSPAKTIEGAVGGLVAAALAGWFAGPRVLPELSAAAGAGIGLALAVAGIAGDLFESLLKRGAGVKDSSSLIPGHGGVLDRIDAQLFAAPVFYLIVRYAVSRP
jgi:phosphatidate cytidylyltransferase